MASDVTIIVPCYNEAGRLDLPAFGRFAAGRDDVAFVFVDDGSTDDTAAMLESFRASYPAVVTVLRLPANAGKGEAVRTGLRAALEASGRYVGYWDADLATPLEAVSSFHEILERRPEIELVMGSRVQLLGRTIERRTARHYLGRVFATAVSVVLGLRVYDTQCGAKLFRATPALATVLAEPFASRWVFDVEILARMIRERRDHDGPRAARSVAEVVYELPLTEWRDVAGSKVRPRDFARAALDVWRIRRRYFGRAGRVLPLSRDAVSAAGSGRSR